MAEESKKANNEKLAIVRIRGSIGVKHDVNSTLNRLMLYKKNYCVVVPGSDPYPGMINKINDYVAWGNIDEETYKLLIDKKGEDYKGRVSDRKGKIKYTGFMEINGRKIKKFFRLNSPRKGYGRKGIKVAFSKGGALGYRAEKINDLVKRMI